MAGPRLVVVRHAHAHAHAAGGADHDRLLDGRGRREAAAVARAVAGSGPHPVLVLSSTARRAAQTAEAVAGALPGAALECEAALYQADADDLVDRLRRLEEPGVVLVGHNPAVHDLVLLLAGEAGPARFPPAAMAALTVGAGGWAALGPGVATLETVWTPG